MPKTFRKWMICLIQVTEEKELKKWLNTNPKTIALFYASWCPFCRSFLSVFNKHAQNSKSATCLKVKIDDDENSIWETYSLKAVPSIILFENGEISKRLSCELGAGINEKQFTKWLQSL